MTKSHPVPHSSFGLRHSFGILVSLFSFGVRPKMELLEFDGRGTLDAIDKYRFYSIAVGD